MKSLLAIAFSTALLTHGKASNLAIPDDIREQFNLDEFYQKGLTIEGFPIVSSNAVLDVTLHEAKWIVSNMLAERTDILHALSENNVRMAIMATDERTRDIPEHSDLGAHYDRRARGLGSTPQRPAISGGEENILGLEGDPYKAENILIHEFAHAIHTMALNTIDPTFDKRLRELYQNAMTNGLWEGTYAATNHIEYWAEGVQSWFDCNAKGGSVHNHVDTREKLIEYDPELAALCKEVFGENPWRYKRPDHPSRINTEHLKSLNRESLPTFDWNKTRDN